MGASQMVWPIQSPFRFASPGKHSGCSPEKWIATSCLNCPARCAIRVRILNGKAVKITGNPLSFVSEGKVCPRAHVGLQVLYDPGRILFPLKRTNKEKGKGHRSQMGSYFLGSGLEGGYSTLEIFARECSTTQTSPFRRVEHCE